MGTLTPVRGLYKPLHNEVGWDALVNGNFDNLDATANKSYVDSQDASVVALIPTKTSQITNDSGFVTSGGAAAAAPVQSVAGKTGVVTLVEADIANLVSDLALKAPLASPALTGNPTAPTQAANDNSTKLATTAYADRIASGGGAVTSVAGKTGAVTLVEADIANLVSDLALLAPLASPVLTGNPTAPTQAAGDNSTKLATTAYTDRTTAQATAAGGGVWYPCVDTGGASITWQAATTIAATANRVYMLQVVLRQVQKIAAITFHVGATAALTAGNNLGIGIYDLAGANLLASINVAGLVGTGTGKRTTITPVTLQPGVYWFTWVCTITTPTLHGLLSSMNANLFGALTPAIRWGYNSTGNSSAAGSLPSTLSLPDTFLAQPFPQVLCEPS